MQDNDATNRMLVSGTMGLLSGTAIHGFHISVLPQDKQLEGLHTFQRILVVEDDPTLAALEADFLTVHGYIVVTVNSGELAIATLHHFIPDLVVLDLELNGNVHGWDVLQTLRASTGIPVILTTSSTTAARKQIRSNGETRLTLDHLPKPYPIQTLLKRVKRMLMIAPQ